MSLNVEPEDLVIVKEILSAYPQNFVAYGSRVRGSNSKFSDLDLCSLDPIDIKTIFEIKEKFSNSNLPFFVDLVCLQNLESWFVDEISKDFCPI